MKTLKQYLKHRDKIPGLFGTIHRTYTAKDLEDLNDAANGGKKNNLFATIHRGYTDEDIKKLNEEKGPDGWEVEKYTVPTLTHNPDKTDKFGQHKVSISGDTVIGNHLGGYHLEKQQADFKAHSVKVTRHFNAMKKAGKELEAADNAYTDAHDAWENHHRTHKDPSPEFIDNKRKAFENYTKAKNKHLLAKEKYEKSQNDLYSHHSSEFDKKTVAPLHDDLIGHHTFGDIGSKYDADRNTEAWNHIGAINRYSEGSNELNMALIGVDGDHTKFGDDSTKQKQVNRLHAALHSAAPLLKDLSVYSGTKLYSPYQSFKNGKGIIKTPAFTSTSIDPKTALGFSSENNRYTDDSDPENPHRLEDCHVIQFNLPKGSKHGRYIAEHSKYGDEREFLLKHNQHWKLKKHIIYTHHEKSPWTSETKTVKTHVWVVEPHQHSSELK